MTSEQATKILTIHQYDLLGYARDLSYDPSKQEIAQAIETAVQALKDRDLRKNRDRQYDARCTYFRKSEDKTLAPWA